MQPCRIFHYQLFFFVFSSLQFHFLSCSNENITRAKIRMRFIFIISIHAGSDVQCSGENIIYIGGSTLVHNRIIYTQLYEQVCKRENDHIYARGFLNESLSLVSIFFCSLNTCIGITYLVYILERTPFLYVYNYIYIRYIVYTDT